MKCKVQCLSLRRAFVRVLYPILHEEFCVTFLEEDWQNYIYTSGLTKSASVPVRTNEGLSLLFLLEISFVGYIFKEYSCELI